MRHFTARTPTRWVAALALAISTGLTATHSNAKTWSASFDNDFLVPASRDQDYTYGISYAIADTAPQSTRQNIAPWLQALGAKSHHTRSIEWGMYGFTPAETAPKHIQVDDRPYASLVYANLSHSYQGQDPRDRWYHSVTVGALGLSLVGKTQTEFHQWIGSERPNGWNAQISDGGELTARLRLAKQRLHVISSNTELSSTQSLSVGYITEATTGFSVRAGHLNSDWQQGEGSLSVYRERGPILNHSRQHEHYIAGGLTLRYRAYNAFLQGQFRDSAHTIHTKDLRHLLLEAWASYVTSIGGYRIDYTLKGHSPELAQGKGQRTVIWGGLTVSHAI